MDNNQQSSFLISDLLNNIDIVSVIKNYINLTKKGNSYWGLCPFHGDKNPSLSVSSDKKVFKCFTCGEKGNAISFVQKYKKINFYQALKEVIELTNYRTDVLNKFLNNKINSNEIKMFEMNKQACFIYHRTLFNSENAHVLNYLLSRNLTKELIEEYKIGYAPNSKNKKYLFSILTNEDDIMGENRDQSLVWSPIQLANNGLVNFNDDNQFFDFFWNRIIIPIFDEHNNILGFSGRTLSQDEKIKYINTKTTEIFQKENVLFNLNNFDKSDYDEIFIVEGYMDVFAFRKIGIDNVVASMGTSFTNHQINLIKKYNNIKTIVVCFDNDNAGYNATIELAEKLYNNNFKVFVVAPYDAQFKDIDELLKAKGIKLTNEIVNHQISFVHYLIIKHFSNIDNNEKDIVLNTKKILDIISNYAYDELTIDSDLTLLNKHSNISVDALKSYLTKFREENLKRKQTYENKSERIFFPRDFDYYFPKYDVENKPLDDILKNQKTNEKKEIDLLKLVSMNTFLAELFTKNIYHQYFQTDSKMKQIFSGLVFFIKTLLDNSIDISPESILKIIELQKDDFNNSLDDLIHFVESTISYYKKYPITEKQIIFQGISLMIDLLLEIKKEIQKNIIKENSPNVDDEYIFVNNEYNKKIRELLKIKSKNS